MIIGAPLRFTDLRADRLYTSLVRAIATGRRTPGELAREVGRNSASDIFPQLNRLVEVGIVAPMDMRDLGGLRHAAAMAEKDLRPIFAPWRVCFARSGFHPDLVAVAAAPENRVVLVDVDRLYE